MIREAIGGLLVLGPALAAVRGTRRLLRGVGQAVPLDVIRGLRGWAMTVAAVAFAVGVFSAHREFLVFGAVFLAEELYETALLAAIIRFGACRDDTGRVLADCRAGR